MPGMSILEQATAVVSPTAERNNACDPLLDIRDLSQIANLRLLDIAFLASLGLSMLLSTGWI